MRIDVITVISGLDEKALEARRDALRRYAGPATDVRLVVTGDGPPSVESEAELELAGPGILRAVVDSSRDGTDAIVIWGGHDPSLRAARELVDVPVIAPGMASILVAVSLAERFSLLVQLPNVIGIAERQVAALGLAGRCAAIMPVNVPVLELASESAFPALLRAALESIDEHAAGAICFGCMAMTPHAGALAQALADLRPGAVVVDPGRAAIRWAEMVVGMGLTHSGLSYPAPPKPVDP